MQKVFRRDLIFHRQQLITCIFLLFSQSFFKAFNHVFPSLLSLNCRYTFLAGRKLLSLNISLEFWGELRWKRVSSWILLRCHSNCCGIHSLLFAIANHDLTNYFSIAFIDIKCLQDGIFSVAEKSLLSLSVSGLIWFNFSCFVSPIVRQINRFFQSYLTPMQLWNSCSNLQQTFIV